MEFQPLWEEGVRRGKKNVAFGKMRYFFKLDGDQHVVEREEPRGWVEESPIVNEWAFDVVENHETQKHARESSS